MVKVEMIKNKTIKQEGNDIRLREGFVYRFDADTASDLQAIGAARIMEDYEPTLVMPEQNAISFRFAMDAIRQYREMTTYPRSGLGV